MDSDPGLVKKKSDSEFRRKDPDPHKCFFKIKFHLLGHHCYGHPCPGTDSWWQHPKLRGHPKLRQCPHLRHHYDNTPICDTPPDVATASAAGTPKAAANTPSILYITNCSSTRHHRAQVLKVNSDSVRLREAHWAHPSPAPKLALCHRPAQHPKLALGHKPAQHPSSSPAPKLVLSHRLARHPMLALGHRPALHPC